MAVACAAVQLAAMPTEDEAKRAEPAVQKLLEPERAALKSGKKTYSEVAVASMKLVGEVDTDAEKLLLMKGAFVLYVLDGNFEKSVETMKALKAAIPDIPPQSITNLIETALLGVAKKEDGARLYKLLDESNAAGNRPKAVEAFSFTQYNFNSALSNIGVADDWMNDSSRWLAVPVSLTTSKLAYSDFNVGAYGLELNHFPGHPENTVPQWFATKTTARLVARSAGTYTFCVISDDGFRCTLTHSGVSESFEYAGKRNIGCNFFTTSLQQGEIIDVDLRHFSYGGGALALKVAKGSYDFYDSSAFRFVGDPASGIVMADTNGSKVERGVPAEPKCKTAQKLQGCDFLLNEDFKKNAKYYLCLFSASWCGPCRAEMPRIAKTYAESLKDNPNVELIHFSRDNDENKALAWAKEHNVKFPVVKYNGGNPLDLHTRGIPQLFIVDADGNRLEEGHPASLFTNEKLDALKSGTYTVPETATEKTRKAIAKLFPGWSLDTEVCDDNAAGIQPIIRGKRNVTCVHPKKGPSVISRTVKLSGNNPCLSLCVASWNDDADILLSVRVNGKEVLTNRVVGTTDAAPWEDIVVPLSAWRGSTVKIEVGFANYGRRWYEIPCLARVDIIEADGDMSIKEGKCEVGGYTWSYRAQNGEATIVAENDGRFSTAVSPCPVGDITIPATLAGAKVTHIGRDAFRDCSALTSVTIPEGVLRIGRGAFFNCSGLRSIAIPSSVKIIERDAFANCTALTSVSIPEGVTIIDRGVFYLCDGLGSIEIPSSVTRIGRDAFTFCRGLASVTIPEGVTSIAGAFYDCTGLRSITIPSSVKNIEGAFTKCRGLQSVTIPEGVTSIDRGAFGWCFGLKSIKIPSSVTQIGREAFAHCRAVASVTIPGKVADIGPDAFVGWRALATVTIPASVTNIDHKAFGHTGALTSFQVEPGNRFYKAENGMLLTKDGTTLVRGVNGDVTIPTSVTAIGPCAFEGCLSLRSVEIPSEVKIIGSYAFKQCRWVKSVTIPSSVKDIGQEAFHDCGSLTSVTMLGERPDAPNGIFKGCGKLKTIHVPANAKSWAGMKDWHGIQLVFDGKDDAVARSPADMNGAYCVIDISGGSNAEHYPVSYLAAEPKGGWTDEHKTTKLVLRRIEPGKFKMRGQYEVTLTKPFYCGVFEVTQKQYELVMGNNPSEFKGDMRPVESVSWGMIRGDSAKYNWPSSANVDSSSFIGKIRVRTGLKFDLPTEAQWEYACRAGTTSKFNNGGDSETDLKKLGRCNGNQSDGKGGNSSHHTTVGSYEPNRWGLYDMHGNVWEACLDWRGNLSSGVTDPQGPSSGAVRVARGGCWRSSMSHCVPSYQDGNMSPSDRYDCGIGFRVCIGEPLGDWNNATTTTPNRVENAFSLNVAPGSITELDLGNVPPLQFVYCPAGKFSMGYKDQPALSKVKDVEITSPFWVSKTPIRADQLEFMGLNSNTNAETGDAVINDGSIVLEKLPSALKERFGKMLPPGYVSRLPTEAEFEYLQKSEMNDKNAQTNIWGVERLYSGGLVALLDKAPAYGRVDVVRRRNHRGVIMTDLVKVNYENQPDKDPVGWTDDPTWSVFRRGLARNCGGGKLVTAPGGGKYHYSFYFVVAPDVDKLNKFYWK